MIVDRRREMSVCMKVSCLVEQEQYTVRMREEPSSDRGNGYTEVFTAYVKP